jgi:hypothetical protein
MISYTMGVVGIGHIDMQVTRARAPAECFSCRVAHGALYISHWGAPSAIDLTGPDYASASQLG